MVLVRRDGEITLNRYKEAASVLTHAKGRNCNIVSSPEMQGAFGIAFGGQSLFALPETEHNELRRQLNPHFSFTGVKARISEFAFDESSRMINKWVREGSAKVNEDLKKLAFNVICEILFSETLPEEVAENITQSVHDLQPVVIKYSYQSRVKSRRNGSDPVKVRPADAERIKATRNSLEEVVNRRMESQKDFGPADKPKDVLQTLIDAGRTKEQIFDQMITFVAAGHDTSSWFMSQLVQVLTLPENAHILEELVSAPLDEDGTTLKNAFRKGADYKSYLLANVQKLDVLSSAIKESCRLAPPSSAITKQSKVDLTYDDLAITPEELARNAIQSESNDIAVRSGQNFNIDIAGALKDPDRFQNPEEFDPRRDNLDDVYKVAFANILGKDHACLGLHLAPYVTQIVIANIFGQVDLDIVSRCEKTRKSVVMQMMEPIIAQVTPRSGETFEAAL